MFKKAAITLFCLAIVSNSAYTMERKSNFYNIDDISGKSYEHFVNKKYVETYPEALSYASGRADVFEDCISRKSSFEDILDCAENAFIVYLALIKQGYQEAFLPAAEFAQNAFAFKGSSKVKIPSIDSCNNITPQFRDSLLNETRLYILLYAAKTYAALLENDKHCVNDYCDAALSCADFIIFQVTKTNLCHNWASVYNSLNNEAARIYAQLILDKNEKACESGEKFANMLSGENTNYMSKTSAAKVYAELLAIRYNFNAVSEQAEKLIRLNGNKNILPYEDVSLMLYTGFVKSGDKMMAKEAFQFLKTNNWPDCGYSNKTTDLMFKLCIALIQTWPDEVDKYFMDYAQNLLARCEKNGDWNTVLTAMPFLVALNKAGFLPDDDLQKFKNMIPSNYNS